MRGDICLSIYEMEENRREKREDCTALDKKLTETGNNIRVKALGSIQVKANGLEEKISKIQGRKSPILYNLDEKGRSATTAHITEHKEFRSKRFCIEERRIELDIARDERRN